MPDNPLFPLLFEFARSMARDFVDSDDRPPGQNQVGDMTVSFFAGVASVMAFVSKVAGNPATYKTTCDALRLAAQAGLDYSQLAIEEKHGLHAALTAAVAAEMTHYAWEKLHAPRQEPADRPEGGGHAAHLRPGQNPSAN